MLNSTILGTFLSISPPFLVQFPQQGELGCPACFHGDRNSKHVRTCAQTRPRCHPQAAVPEFEQRVSVSTMLALMCRLPNEVDWVFRACLSLSFDGLYLGKVGDGHVVLTLQHNGLLEYLLSYTEDFASSNSPFSKLLEPAPASTRVEKRFVDLFNPDFAAGDGTQCFRS